MPVRNASLSRFCVAEQMDPLACRLLSNFKATYLIQYRCPEFYKNAGKHSVHWYDRGMEFELLNAVSALAQPDGVIAFPMGDCYVLACRVGHGDAMARLLRIKGVSQAEADGKAPLSRMVTLLGWDLDALRPFASKLPAVAEKLIAHYWPGALVLLLPPSCNPQLANLQIGVMQPSSELVRDLLGMQPEGALFTVEASRYDDAPAQTARAVHDAMGDDVDYVLQCDAVIRPKSSATVISVDADGSVNVLRPGDIVLD